LHCDIDHVEASIPRVRINTAAILDWPSFHAECQRALGFPAFYGANMDAWIDCMSSLRDDVTGAMVEVCLGHDEVLLLEVPDAEGFWARLPEIARELWECSAFVNRRFAQLGESPAIVLVPL
jgi:hypothetical protein